VFKQIPNVMNIIPVIHNLIKELAEPYDIMSHKITPCNNIGLTSYPQGQILRPEELIRQSHLAAYEAKFAGENQYKFFDSPMELQKIKQNQLIEDIRIAMTNNQLMVYYQPKVNMKTGVILGAEALLRLNHPEKGILSPDSFLPSISNHPVFTEIGEWVLHQALNDLEKSLIAHHVFPISINISPYHLQQEHFLSNLKDILIEHPKVRSNLIELEILETEVLTNISGIKKLINECKKIGVLFALDDFGTGYSSLTYLKELPASKVKLDQSFVRDIINKPENIPILKACIQMCKLLKREVIAEGVENIEIGKLLLYLGCTHAQGYKISKPMSIEECCQWSKQWSSFPEWNISTEGQKEGRLLVNAIMGHFARIDLLKNFLILNDSSSIMEILKKCPLDIWLNRQRHILADKNKIKLMQLYEMHAVIYSVTQEIFKLQQEGKKTLAYKRMEQLESLNSDLLHQLLCLNL